MNKVIAKLPDWIGERRITILAGIEEVARRINGVWYIKTSRCATALHAERGEGEACGECCKRAHGSAPEDHCVHYRGGASFNTCTLHWPYACLTGDMEGEDYCNVKWERINGI